MKFLQKPNSKNFRFIYEHPGLADGPEVAVEPKEEDLGPQQQLEKALWEVAENPTNPHADYRLEEIIKTEAAKLSEKLGTNAVPALDRYIDENNIEESSLQADEIEALTTELSETVDAEGEPLTDEEVEAMKTMSNRELLEMSRADRLRLITKENVSYESVAGGSVSELEFTFTFGDSAMNQELYKNTTAGQVLPPEVREVTSGGNVFQRAENSLQGEFFSETGQRLKIHEGTQLTDITVGDVSEIQAGVDEKLAAFEGKDEERLVAEMALQYGIQPEFVMAAFVKDGEIETEIDEEAAAVLTSEERERAVSRPRLTSAYRAGLENFLTDISRTEGDFNGRFSEEEARVEGRLSPNFAAFFLAEGNDESGVKEIMGKADYTEDEMSEIATYIAARKEFNSGGATNPLNAEILASGEVNVVPGKQDKVNQAVEGALANKERYERVAAVTGIPWELIAGIHYREGSYDFTTYLHNGQPLGQRTTIVPKGILFNNWEDAAIDALKGGYGNALDGDLASQANFAERFNGMGYRNRGLTSPYVWAGHPSYENQGGMYVADGQFSQTTRDQRVGVMPIVMVLRARQGKSNGGAPAVA